LTNLSESVSPHSSQSTFFGGFLLFVCCRASGRGSLGTDRFRSLHNLRKSKLYLSYEKRCGNGKLRAHGVRGELLA